MKSYKKRFIKEYNELNDRCKKLDRMLNKYKADKLDFNPTCPVYILERQLEEMQEYRNTLRLRAEYEDIELEY